MCGSFAIGVGKDGKTSIYFDTGDNPLGLEDIHKLDTFIRRLVESLLKHDRAGNVLAKAWGGVEELTPCTAVVFGVLDTYGIEALAGGGVGLIGSEDASTAGGDVLGGGTELLLKGVGSGTDDQAGAKAGSTGSGNSL